jgi:hypothetical protein
MLRRRPRDNPLQQNVRRLLEASPGPPRASLEMALSRRKPWSRIRRFVRRGAHRLKRRVANGLADLGSWLIRQDEKPFSPRRCPGVSTGSRPLTPVPGVAFRQHRWDLDRGRDRPAAEGAAARRLRRQWTCSQARSPLFARLPPELRARVFAHVVAGRFLQVVSPHGGCPSPRSLACSRDLYSHARCAHAGGVSCVLLLFQRHKPWGSAADADVPEGFGGAAAAAAAGRGRGMLPLLQACRRMYAPLPPPGDVRTRKLTWSRYAEALPIMYASTVFAVNATYRISGMLRLPLFSLVRRLLVAATASCHRGSPARLEKWREWTARLARMPLLQELHVHVFFVSGRREYWAERMAMLEALRGVGRRRVFVVTEYHRMGIEVGEVDVEKMPFVLRQGFFVK